MGFLQLAADRVRFDITRLRGAGASFVVILGIALTLGIFAFQTLQPWISSKSRDEVLQWAFPSVAALGIIFFLLLGHAYYWMLRTRHHTAEADPYRAFVDGILSYAEALHQQQRDPALLRLRENESLTLHVLGFHNERVKLGTWALESAQFVNDHLGIISILIDDLGWANYLLGKDSAVTNIEKAIRYGEQLPEDFGEPRKSILLAKAYRHLSVINTARRLALDNDGFNRAIEILTKVSANSSNDVSVDLAHVSHAEALAIATMLNVNVTGSLRRTDTEGVTLLQQALHLVREAKEGFSAAKDQGRFAKSLVLEVRLLEALHDDDGAQQLIPLRDRAVASSVWARPAGAAFITGR